jgi:mRNA interferase MazF
VCRFVGFRAKVGWEIESEVTPRCRGGGRTHPTVGHEQCGTRPCVVVRDPDVISDQRVPLVCVVPITGTPGEGLLYPQLPPGTSGLAKAFFALIDHLRSIDKRRVRRVFGELAKDEIAAIDEGLAVFLGLGPWLRSAGAPSLQ